MKKFLVLFLTLTLALSLVACATPDNGDGSGTPAASTPATPDVPADPEVNVLTYAEYMAAEVNAEVTVEAYVQACRSWWDNKITIYAQTSEGGYFFYDITCAEEDAAKLVKGTKIRVTGTKTVYAGEVEIMGGTFEIIENDTWVAEAADLTALLGTADLEAKMNTLAAFKGLTVVSVDYENDEAADGNDIYVKVALGENEFEFCVQSYLTPFGSDVYTAAGELEAGDVIDVEAFVYWWNGPNPHIVSVSKVAE